VGSGEGKLPDRASQTIYRGKDSEKKVGLVCCLEKTALLKTRKVFRKMDQKALLNG